MDANDIGDPEAAELERTEDPIEMANLPPSRTGIDGVIFVSTRMGPHGPRVNYYERPGRAQPSFSMTIADPPIAVASSLPERVVAAAAALVARWVSLNRDALLDFWAHGDSWMQPAVEAFLGGLAPLPR